MSARPIILYRPEVQNWCPGCGKSNWFVGRFSAECAFCATAIEIKQAPRTGWARRHWKAAA